MQVKAIPVRSTIQKEKRKKGDGEKQIFLPLLLVVVLLLILVLLLLLLFLMLLLQDGRDISFLFRKIEGEPWLPQTPPTACL